MRMALCWSSLILLIFGFSTHANAAPNSNFTLTPELAHFIPPCAQECFLSFLDANFPEGAYSAKPTLGCLCSSNGTSGYTIGEGAVQCIISEINVGFCQGKYANDSVMNSAYGMCSGQPNALPNTHATITATLIIHTTKPSIVLVAPAQTTLLNTSRMSSVTASTTAKASSSTLATATSRPNASSSASSTVSSVPAPSETSSSEPFLSKSQIVGITVASIGGGAVAVGLSILFICCRRRKNKKARERDLIPFQLEPGHVMEQRKYKYKDFKGPTLPTERRPGGTRDGLAGKIPPRIPPRLDTSNPNMFSRRSIRPDTIGLAISPEQPISIEKQQRRSSKLLPEKPTLTLKVPKQAEKPINGFSFNHPNPIARPSAVSRQSTATQFEEDYDGSADATVAADDSWTAKSTDQISDVGTRTWQTIRKVDPEPGTGNPGKVYHLRPGQNTKNGEVNPDYYIRPLRLGGRKIPSFSQPRMPNVYVRKPGQQLSVPEQTRLMTASSSLDSARGSVSSNHQGPDGNGNSRPHRFSYQQAGPYDNQESLVSPQDRDQESGTAGTDYPFSPVVESPASGRSPVNYPKIPPPGAGGLRLLSQSTIRMVPPPPQPDFTKALGGGRPWRQAEIAAQIERERAARAQAQIQGQGQMGMQPLRTQGQTSHQQQRPREPRIPSPRRFAFPAPPPQVFIRGRSQTTTAPPVIPSPYLFRTPWQSKLVPQPLLLSRSKVQREPRTPPPSQNQGGFIAQQGQLQTATISAPTIMTPPPGLLRSRSQILRDGMTPSPNLSLLQNQTSSQSQSQSQFQNRTQQQIQRLQSAIESPSLSTKLTLTPPLLFRTRSQLQREARTLPPIQTQTKQPQQQPRQQSQLQEYAPQLQPQSRIQAQRPLSGNPLTSHLSTIFTRTSSLLSQASSLTNISASSSLLAKRRGTEKASALTLKNEGDRQKQIAKWRVFKREENELAKKEGWRPGEENIGVDGDVADAGGNGVLGPRDGIYEFERTELPTTPSWVPKLTPTRRGDKLFLSVQ